MTAIDSLGYFFMSLASIFAAFAFRHQKWLFRALLWNGSLLPILMLALFFPVFYLAGVLWMITFPIAMITVAMFFKTAVFTIKMGR